MEFYLYPAETMRQKLSRHYRMTERTIRRWREPQTHRLPHEMSHSWLLRRELRRARLIRHMVQKHGGFVWN